MANNEKPEKSNTTSPGSTVLTPSTITQNRYAIFDQEASQADAEGKPLPPAPQNHKPPPIVIHGVINYDQMIKSIREVAEDEHYFTKSMANNAIKLISSTPDTYRSLIKY